MFAVLLKFFRWVFEKFAAGVLIVTLGFAACALWLFLKDNVDFDQWRREIVRSLNGERTKVQSALADVNQRIGRIGAEITAEEQRAGQADKVIANLKELASTWDRYVGNRAQQKTNDERLASMTTLRQSLTTKIQSLRQEMMRATWERDGLEIALGRLDTRLQQVEARRSKVLHYVEGAWNYQLGRGWLKLPVKWWAVVALGLYFAGPTAGKMTMYFFVAPFITRGRPVRLVQVASALPDVGTSGAAIEVALRSGERLWVKERFLQASDEGLRRKTRYLLDWRIPLTCVATGLIELIEMRHEGGDAGEQRLTLSNQGDPHSELSLVTLPEGASLVLRPSFLAAVVTANDRRLSIRRHWQLFRWQSWVTLQFRFFEFVGPCRLVLAGSRGVRAENLSDREGSAIPARRTNQDATIGFTPNLDYRPVRAETFWSYYRGMNPLFDDLFAGRGIFLCQQVATSGDARNARRFWAGIWGGLMKAFGL
jgi:hypothetical protein